MRPTQLCTQRVHNLAIGEDLRKTHHIEEVAPAETAAVLGCETFAEPLNDALAVFRSLVTKNVLANPRTNTPIEHDHSGVDHRGNTLAGLRDQLPNVGQQAFGLPRLKLILLLGDCTRLRLCLLRHHSVSFIFLPLLCLCVFA